MRLKRPFRVARAVPEEGFKLPELAAAHACPALSEAIFAC